MNGATLRGALRWLLPLALAGCGGGDEPRAARPRNLLLVTLDTTRADALGCYGGPAATPRLDALARGGARFERCYAPTPLTMPSHASLMTGTLPPEHGVHENGRAPLGDSLTTLAETCAARGLRTGAFIGALVLDSRFGLARGFDLYEDELDGAIQRRGSVVVERALEWLALAPDEPFCAWVHLFDAHAPYEPPREHWDGRSHPYYGEVAFADAQLGRLLDWLEESGRAADTLVVVTADHGESLGEHGELTHSTLVYDATLHVPLVVSAPGYCAAGVVVETPVHLVDVFASVCEVLDWGLPAGAGGRSFAPALRGAELAARPLYAESEYARINFGWGRLRALYDGDWKYIDGPRPELYDLARDPRELADQIAAEPARAARMRAALEELLAGLERRRTGTLAPDEELTHGMAALGYAQASAPAADVEVEDPRNPAELVHVVQLYLDAVGLCQRDAFAEAAPLLERAIEADPRAVGFRILLAVCQRQTGHPDAAIETLEGALVLDERQERAHLELAHALLAVERGDEALAHALRAVEIRPGYREARMKVAELYLARGERDLCLEQYRAVLAEFPLEDGLRNATVALLRDMGRERERLEALEGGIRDNPVSGPDWAARTAFELATHPDAELRDDEKALLYARAANQASGRRAPRHLDALAAAQASVGRFDAALKNATEAARLARAAGLEQLAAAVEARLELYRAGQPFRAAR